MAQRKGSAFSLMPDTTEPADPMADGRISGPGITPQMQQAAGYDPQFGYRMPGIGVQAQPGTQQAGQQTDWWGQQYAQDIFRRAQETAEQARQERIESPIGQQLAGTVPQFMEYAQQAPPLQEGLNYLSQYYGGLGQQLQQQIQQQMGGLGQLYGGQAGRAQQMATERTGAEFGRAAQEYALKRYQAGIYGQQAATQAALGLMGATTVDPSTAFAAQMGVYAGAPSPPSAYEQALLMSGLGGLQGGGGGVRYQQGMPPMSPQGSFINPIPEGMVGQPVGQGQVPTPAGQMDYGSAGYTDISRFVPPVYA